MAWLEPLMPLSDTMLRPNWEAVFQYVDDNLHDQDPLWYQIALKWACSLSRILDASSSEHRYSIIETENFILLSSDSEGYNKRLSGFLERCRKRLLHNGREVLLGEGFSKHLVLVFADLYAYYDYVSFYGPQD